MSKNNKYTTLKVLILVILIVGVGYFALKFAHTSSSTQTGLVINTPQVNTSQTASLQAPVHNPLSGECTFSLLASNTNGTTVTGSVDLNADNIAEGVTLATSKSNDANAHNYTLNILRQTQTKLGIVWATIYSKTILNANGLSINCFKDVGLTPAKNALIVSETYSGAGTTTNWYALENVKGSTFSIISPTTVRANILASHNDEFEGYNTVAISPTQIVESMPGYLIGNPQCCPAGNPITIFYVLNKGAFSVVNFSQNGIQVGPYSAPSINYTPPSGSQTHGTFTMTIPFSVTAVGATAYIPSTSLVATTSSASANIQYCVDIGTCFIPGGASTTGTTEGVVVYTGGLGLVPDANHNYVIKVGQSQNFELVITFQPGNTSGSALYRASLLNVNWNNTDSSTTYNTFTSGLNTASFKTPYLAGN